jgi:hypothetical protein
MIAVTAMALMPAVPLLTVVCQVVLVPAAARMLGVCVSPPLLDGSVTSFARAVLGPVRALLTMVSVLVMAMAVVVGVSRCDGVGPTHW